MLTSYLAATRGLLQNPSAPTSLYSTTDLTTYINSARGQLAGEAECCRFMASLAVSAAGGYIYPFTATNLTGSAGVQGILAVRMAWYQVGSGQRLIRLRSFEWFGHYELNNPVPDSGPPRVWAQYGQGAEAQSVPNPVGGGSIYLSPIPDANYTLRLDTVCYPVPLTDDSTPEAIPYLWTDAVPYYAAYLALLGAQTGARTAEADKMFERYQMFVARARGASTPSVMPGSFPQAPSLVRANQLGAAPQSGGRTQ